MGFQKAKMQLALVCLMLALCFNIKATNHYFTPNSTAFDRHIIPFRLIKKLMIVQAYVNGKTGNFIIDTGVKSLTLNAKYFSHGRSSSIRGSDFSGSGLEIKETATRFGWIKGQEKSQYALLTHLHDVETILGMEILGYVGYEVLREYEVAFDYKQQMITLFHLDNKGHRKTLLFKEQTVIDTIPLRKNAYLPYMIIHLGSQKLKLAIDTGASLNLLRDEIVQNIGAYFQHTPPRYIAGFSGQKSLVESGTLDQIRVNELPLAPMYCVVTNMKSLNITLDTEIDGLLGYEFLSQYKISINYARNEVYVWGAK